MSLNAELAGVARWIRAVAERLPEDERPDVARLWSQLCEALEDAPTEAQAREVIAAWREGVASQLKVPA